jgi:hypothetical protein
VLEAMRNWVFDYVTPDRLLSLTRLGQARELGGPVVDFLACERVKDWFFSYLDFPKLIDIRGLQKCIAAGVKDRAFGYVVGPRLDDTGQLTVEDRRRVHFGDTLNPDEVDLGSGAYLLSADLASQLSQPPAMDRGTVMGRVWLDADQDGKRTDAEPGLSGVTVRFIQGNTEVGRSVTGQDGSYVSPPLPPGTTKVVLDPTPEYAATTAGFVEVPIARQAQTMADFGLQKKDQGTGSRHYRLRLKANKAQAFTVFRVLQNLSDKADRLTITFDISAEAKDRAGFDPVWLRNAIEEPLDEADITRE